MNEEKIEEIKNALRQILQMISERNQPMKEQLKNALMQLVEHVSNRIQQLREEEVPAQAFQKPNIPQGIPSSNVAGMGYDKKTGNLQVQFLGKYPNRQGPVYQYPNIPPVIAELLQSGAIPARTDGQNKWGKWWKGKVPSAGASVFTLLKNKNVPFQRLS